MIQQSFWESKGQWEWPCEEWPSGEGASLGCSPKDSCLGRRDPKDPECLKTVEQVLTVTPSHGSCCWGCFWQGEGRADAIAVLSSSQSLKGSCLCCARTCFFLPMQSSFSSLLSWHESYLFPQSAKNEQHGWVWYLFGTSTAEIMEIKLSQSWGTESCLMCISCGRDWFLLYQGWPLGTGVWKINAGPCWVPQCICQWCQQLSTTGLRETITWQFTNRNSCSADF